MPTRVDGSRVVPDDYRRRLIPAHLDPYNAIMAGKLTRPMAIGERGVNLSGDQVDPCQPTRRPVALAFMVAREARMPARYRWRVPGRPWPRQLPPPRR
jgi:hypothetical protein